MTKPKVIDFGGCPLTLERIDNRTLEYRNWDGETIVRFQNLPEMEPGVSPVIIESLESAEKRRAYWKEFDAKRNA